MATFSGPSNKPATFSGQQAATSSGNRPSGGSDISGTPEERPASLGPPIDRAWWRGTAEELLRRLPPFPGAGDGPAPAAVDAMASHLPKVVAPLALRPDVGEETHLRLVLSLPGASTDQIREVIVQRMATVLTPAVIAVSAAPRGGPAPQPSSSLPPASSAAPPRGGPRMGRRPPVIRLCADEDDRFAKFRDARVDTQGNVAGALGRGKTWEDVERAVPREDDKWQTWFLLADSIATSASDQELVDDFYNCMPNLTPGGPGIGRRSTFRFGNAVHQELQKRYLTASEFRPNEVVIERYWYGPWPPGRRSRPKGVDLIEERASERLDSVGALSWSFGSGDSPQRIDIGDLKNLTVHEIKPVRSYGLGVLQLWQYVHNFNLSKYFDEQTEGANDVGERMAPGGPLASILQPIDLEKVMASPLPWERRWLAVPWMLDAVPGVIAYTLVRKDRPGDGSPDALHTAVKIAIAAVVAVLVVASVWAVIQLAPEILALAQAAVTAAVETIKANLITAEGVRQIGATQVWDVISAPDFGQAVARGAVKVVSR